MTLQRKFLSSVDLILHILAYRKPVLFGFIIQQSLCRNLPLAQILRYNVSECSI
jgi:hypothetical protein